MKLIPLRFTHLTEKQVARYWSKILKGAPNECWPWIGALKARGRYGNMTVNKENVGATHVGWFIVHGYDSYPLQVLHTCDHPWCMNPSHWFKGTNRDNCADKCVKGRSGRKLTTP